MKVPVALPMFASTSAHVSFETPCTWPDRVNERERDRVNERETDRVNERETDRVNETE